MKTPLFPRLRDSHLAARGWAVFSLALALGLSAAEPAAAASGDYTLFVGLDVEVPWQEEHRPIRRLVDRNRGAEIDVEGDLHEVSIRNSETLRLRRQLKVGRQPAIIAGLAAKRTYSPGNDPFHHWARMQIALESQASERADQAQGKYLQMTQVPNATARDPAVAAQIAQNKQNAFNDMVQAMSTGPAMDSGQMSIRRSQDLAAEQYDAIEVSFELSSPDHLTEVFMVLLADYTVPGRKEEKRRLIYTRTLGAVSPAARKVEVYTYGLPPGFELHDTRVYLYSFGEEIPTSLSEKMVSMSGENAVQVLLADHLARNRGRTVPAQPIWQTAPADFRARIDPDALPANAELRIDAEGRVTEVLDTNGQPLRIVGLARDVLTATRYLPALENGTPVASTLSVEPPKFLR